MSIFTTTDLSKLVQDYAPTLPINTRLAENIPIETHIVLKYIEFLTRENRCKVCETYFFEWVFSSKGLNICPLYNKKKEHIHI